MYVFFIGNFEEHQEDIYQRLTTMMSMMTIISMNSMKKMTEYSL